MKRHAPEVRDYMTHLPVEAEHCETAADAQAMMRRQEVHHIPVMIGSHLKGIVSQQDLMSAELRMGDDFPRTPLEQICSSDTLSVNPVDRIDDVVRRMLERRTDIAVVIDGGFVVGVFTTTDVLRFVGDHFGQS